MTNIQDIKVKGIRVGRKNLMNIEAQRSSSSVVSV